jgi:hypothetical protein
VYEVVKVEIGSYTLQGILLAKTGLRAGSLMSESVMKILIVTETEVILKIVHKASVAS